MAAEAPLTLRTEPEKHSLAMGTVGNEENIRALLNSKHLERVSENRKPTPARAAKVAIQARCHSALNEIGKELEFFKVRKESISPRTTPTADTVKQSEWSNPSSGGAARFRSQDTASDLVETADADLDATTEEEDNGDEIYAMPAPKQLAPSPELAPRCSSQTPTRAPAATAAVSAAAEVFTATVDRPTADAIEKKLAELATPAQKKNNSPKAEALACGYVPSPIVGLEGNYQPSPIVGLEGNYGTTTTTTTTTAQPEPPQQEAAAPGPKTPARRALTCDYAPSPIVGMEGTYDESETALLSQAQVDDLLAKREKELELKHTVTLGLFEDQMGAIVVERDQLVAKQKATDAVVKQFEDLCFEYETKCNSRVLAMSSMAAKTQADLDSCQARSIVVTADLQARTIEVDALQKNLVAAEEEKAEMAAKVAKQADDIVVMAKKREKAKRRAQRCDERYEQHIDQAQIHNTKLKGRLQEVEAQLASAQANEEVFRAKQKVAEAEAHKTSAETHTLQQRIKELEACGAAAATKARAEQDETETKALAQVEAEKQKCIKLEAEKADWIDMCNDLMEQLNKREKNSEAPAPEESS